MIQEAFEQLPVFNQLPIIMQKFLFNFLLYLLIMTVFFLLHKYALGRRALQWSWYIGGPFMWLMLFRDLARTKKKSIEELAKYGIKERGQTVLDYGCGTGSYAINASPIVGNAGKVYAADINPFGLYAVRAKARLKGLKNVKTILTNRDTGLPNESVDVVMIIDALHDFRGKEAIVKEMYRVLKPSGVLSIFEDVDRKIPKAIAQIEGTGLFELTARDKRFCRFKKVARS